MPIDLHRADLETSGGVYRSILRRRTAESRLPRNRGVSLNKAGYPSWRESTTHGALDPVGSSTFKCAEIRC
jgi:hypothetical protein